MNPAQYMDARSQLEIHRPSEAAVGTARAGPRLTVWSGLGALRGYAAGLASVVVVTLCGYRLSLNLATSGSLYLLVVVVVSVVWGFPEASVTSISAVTCLEYFFVPPVLTWRVDDPQNWAALAAFEAAALLVSRLSVRVQGVARAEARQRAQLEKLYELSRRILLLDRRQSIGPQFVSLVNEIFRTEAVALFDAALARMDTSGSSPSDLEELSRTAYLQDRSLEGPDGCTWAHVLRLGSKPAGALALRSQDLDPLAVAPLASLAAIAIERARSFETESRAEAARQTEQLRTAVLDALAHTFKTPLTAIRTASSGLLEGGRLSPGDEELAALIDEQTEHLNRVTSELLQMARIDAGMVTLRRERVALLTLIEDALSRRREQLGGRHVDVSDSASQLEIYGDRQILATALEQLIDNASKYSTPGTTISVSADEVLNETVIAVHNEGSPIRPADRERIFERFYRADESRHRATGTGLGLSIAAKSAEAHGGRTWVVSDEGLGTTFYFAVPNGKRRQL